MPTSANVFPSSSVCLCVYACYVSLSVYLSACFCVHNRMHVRENPRMSASVVCTRITQCVICQQTHIHTHICTNTHMYIRIHTSACPHTMEVVVNESYTTYLRHSLVFPTTPAPPDCDSNHVGMSNQRDHLRSEAQKACRDSNCHEQQPRLVKTQWIRP